jgi:hypothetical protein
MRKIALALAILGTSFVSALYTAPAHAQATRTWVSGAGNDANPCSRTSPCETFAGAYAKTDAGGEIDALDPGGFGTLTITHSITIDGGGGTVASTLANSGTAISVAAGANDVVIIKNVRFQGLLGGNPSCPFGCGSTGLSYTSGGQVVCDNCAFIGWGSYAVFAQLTATGLLQVRNTTFFNNSSAIFATASGGAGAVVQVVGSSVVGRLSSGSPAEVGITAGSGSFITVGSSNFQDLVYAVFVESGGNLNVDSCLFWALDDILTSSGTTVSASNNSFYSGTAYNGSGTINSANNNKIGGSATVGTTAVNSAGITVD